MLPIPPLSAVRVFEAASRHENFSRAAEELAMTQAGVSYQMKLLEERLGAPLFIRKGRSMILTDLGRRIAPRVTDAFKALGDAFAIARAESDTILGITAPRTLATNWLAGRLGEFHIAHPDLAVRLDVTDQMVWNTYSVEDQAWIAAGKVGEKAGKIFEKNFDRPPTVRLESGTPVGVLVLNVKGR